jgi:hypothetical protein
MRSDVRDLLRPWLGNDLALVDPLSDQDLLRLSDALTTARRNQAKALAAASSEALRQMPAPMRTTIRRILGLR